ncbi:MAG: LuxR C-terminal-related transcriptional regulator [Solirubrobacteraceae bacterium]
MDVVDQLERGRAAYTARVWRDARAALAEAEAASLLDPEDLELLSTAAYMLGLDEEHVGALERAHHAYLERGDALPAARCAFWAGLHLLVRGETGRGTGWLGRAQRLVEREGRECVEQGYLLLPLVVQHRMGGDYERAEALAADAAAIGERYGERDLHALALMEHGGLLLMLGRVDEGLASLDETMVSATAGELSPIVNGLVYCHLIECCHQVYALRRAREWTAALTRWCDQQPDLVSFTGTCLIHRAEIMQLGGDWASALEEARRAARRCAAGNNERAGAQAHYRRGEVHRLRGELGPAEAAYREASRLGYEPQPGLALMRLSQGKSDLAAGAIRRVVAETRAPLQRSTVLPAYVDIMLSVGDVEAARAACRELDEIAGGFQSSVLGALAAQARGLVDLAGGDPQAALEALRSSSQVWHELEAPYEMARLRVLIASACRALGDDDAAALELDAARAVFTELGAATDLAAIDHTPERAPNELTPRELQVLRLVAGGRTNKAIAAELVLSERTVDRHVSNIFVKLGVASRTAATAHAYEHGLV